VREWVSLNGRLMPADQAQISVFDSGFMQGVGLFETMRAYRGQVFRLDQHVQRLIGSARTLGWTVIPDSRVLRENVEQVVGAGEYAEARVRLTVTTGTLRAVESDAPRLTVVASVAPGMTYPREIYRAGVTVIISPYRQHVADPTCGHKTTSYFARLTSLREAHTRGAFEALWFTPESLLAEGAISNVFAVRNGELLTPPLETPVLAGIVRAALLELAAAQRIPLREEPITINDLLDADEVFLTNSMLELAPVVRVERDPIGTEKPGEITQRLHEAYRALVQQECPDVQD
jgi:branched-chain amino acid aminotransferase